jgi:alpha-L-fucosidase
MHFAPSKTPTPATREWFAKPKLGLFLHWGLYALEAWQEQDVWRRQWKREDYMRLIHRFSASKFDPDHWLDVAEMAGATYLCLTAKHLDGFCLWDTKTTEFNVTNSPLGRDVLGDLARACQRRKMPLFVYCSVVDNHQPTYPHAGRRWEYSGPQQGDRPSRKEYLACLREQVRELCSNYGRLAGFWWDANIAQWRDSSLNRMIRKLQPGIVINNRGLDGGDFGTPERDWDDAVNTAPAFKQPVEACQALGSQSWGFRKEEDYYTEVHLLRSIAKILGKGGNFLLNSGPRADGCIASEDMRILRAVGKWMRSTREAFEEVERVPHFVESRDFLLTRRDALTYYVILHKPQSVRSISLKPLASLPAKATELATGRAVETRNDLLPWDHTSKTGFLRLYNLPQVLLNNTVTVIKLEFATVPKLVKSGLTAKEIEP